MRRMWSVVRYVSKEAVLPWFRSGSGWCLVLLETGMQRSGRETAGPRLYAFQASDTGSVPGMVAPGVRRHHNG